MMNEVMKKIWPQPYFSIIYPLSVGAIIPASGQAIFINPKTVARLLGVVFSAIIAIRAIMKKEKDELYNIYNGVTIVNLFMKAREKVGIDDKIMLSKNIFFFPILFMIIPLGIMRNVPTTLAAESIIPIWISVASKLSKNNGNSGCMNWFEKPIAKLNTKSNQRSLLRPII
jgi:hypothetical protein